MHSSVNKYNKFLPPPFLLPLDFWPSDWLKYLHQCLMDVSMKMWMELVQLNNPGFTNSWPVKEFVNSLNKIVSKSSVGLHTFFRIYVASSEHFGIMCHLNDYTEQLLRSWLLSINVNDKVFTFFCIHYLYVLHNAYITCMQGQFYFWGESVY